MSTNKKLGLGLITFGTVVTSFAPAGPAVLAGAILMLFGGAILVATIVNE